MCGDGGSRLAGWCKFGVDGPVFWEDRRVTTPAEFEKKAIRLREIAGDLRKEAPKVADLLKGAKDLQTKETWEGPVAVEFGGSLSDWGSSVKDAENVIMDAALQFERDANALDEQAGDQRRKEKEKEHGPK